LQKVSFTHPHLEEMINIVRKKNHLLVSERPPFRRINHENHGNHEKGGASLLLPRVITVESQRMKGEEFDVVENECRRDGQKREGER
jgi:hypothetical protein